MLFSKLKHKSDELLPPPPPFPSMELEEPAEKHEARPAKSKAVSKDELDDLFREVESLGRKEKKIIPKQEKKGKISVKLPKGMVQAKKPVIKPLKREILPVKKPAIKRSPKKETASKKQKAPAKISGSKGFAFKEPGIGNFQAPESGEIKLVHELEFPEEAKEPDLDLGSIGKGYQENLEFGREFAQKPREIREAEDEIKSAIEKIKKREKPSFFKKLFAGKKAEGQLHEIYEKDDVSAIHGMAGRARQALMKFDLKAAKQAYIEIMKIYNKISPEEQAKVYQEIKDLYYERKSAEGLKV